MFLGSQKGAKSPALLAHTAKAPAPLASVAWGWETPVLVVTLASKRVWVKTVPVTS